MKQLQEYGSFTMKRYSGFLNPIFNPARAFIRSTGSDRTMQSIEAFLSGAYQPADFQKWTSIDGLTNWLPVPVHANDLNIDPVKLLFWIFYELIVFIDF